MLRRVLITVALLALLLGGTYAYRTFGWLSFDRTINPLGLDLSAPDALLSTASLAALPRDILQQPIARRVFTEDLAFYYEAHEDRLSALGAIRRIAYEHDTGWSDALIRQLLNEPAQVAFWRDGKGALRHYVISIKRSAFTVLIEEAGKIALKDTQLTRAGSLPMGLSSVPLFALSVSPRRTFLMAARGDRLVLLSDPGMLLRKDKSLDRAAAAVITNMLDSGSAPFAFPARSAAGKADGPLPRHRFAVNAQTVAFGYQRYFAAFEALRFDLDEQGNWSSAVLLDPARLNAKAVDALPVLQSLPAQPAMCAVLPVHWPSAATLASKSGNQVTASTGTQAANLPADFASALLNQAEGPVGACWYAESSISSPVFATTLKDSALTSDAALNALKAWALRASSTASLLQAKDLVVFSPDQKLAERALAVHDRRLASVADTTGPAATQGTTLAIITPNSLAGLIRAETSRSLAADSEPHLRAAALRHFWPKLDELAKLPAYRVSLGADALQGTRGWHPLIWQSLGSR